MGCFLLFIQVPSWFLNNVERIKLKCVGIGYTQPAYKSIFFENL